MKGIIILEKDSNEDGVIIKSQQAAADYLGVNLTTVNNAIVRGTCVKASNGKKYFLDYAITEENEQLKSQIKILEQENARLKKDNEYLYYVNNELTEKLLIANEQIEKLSK